MVLALQGPPLQQDPDVTRYRRTLPQTLAGYLYTRQWRRDREADRLVALAAATRGQAAVVGITEDGRQRFTDYMRNITERIRELRGPEFPPDLPEISDLPDDVQLILYGRGRLPTKA